MKKIIANFIFKYLIPNGSISSKDFFMFFVHVIGLYILLLFFILILNKINPILGYIPFTIGFILAPIFFWGLLNTILKRISSFGNITQKVDKIPEASKLENSVKFIESWMEENKSKLSLASQAASKKEDLMYELQDENSSKLNGVAIMSDLYHMMPGLDDKFYLKLNNELKNICQELKPGYDLSRFIEILREHELSMYTTVTSGIGKGKVIIPENKQGLIFLTTIFVKYSDNLGLVNFALLFEGLVSTSHELDDLTLIAKNLAFYPETACCANFYLLNAKETSNSSSDFYFDIIKQSTNIHVRSIALHFIMFNLDRLSDLQKKNILINGNEYFSILAQYKIPEFIMKIDQNKLWNGAINFGDAKKIIDLISICLSEGPSSGLFLENNTCDLLRLLILSIINNPETLEEYNENGKLQLLKDTLKNGLDSNSNIDKSKYSDILK